MKRGEARSRRRHALLVIGIGSLCALPSVGMLLNGQTSKPTSAASTDLAAETKGPVMHVDWFFRPDDLKSLARRGGSAVVATVRSIDKGPPLGPADGGEFGDVAPIPTQRVAFSTEETWYGPVPEQFVLFKTGSDQAWIEGDPPYVVGETYVLFLDASPGPGGDTFVPVAPDGRLKVRDGLVDAVIPGAVEREVDGRSIGTIKQLSNASRQD